MTTVDILSELWVHKNTVLFVFVAMLCLAFVVAFIKEWPRK